MPIDPSIIERFSQNYKPLSLPDPMENYQKLMVIQGLQDQRQIQQQNIQEGKMKLQQAQQAAQDEQTYRQMAMQGSVSPEMLESKGLYKFAAEKRNELLKAKKEQTDIDKTLMGMSKDHLDILDKQTKAAQEVGVALDSIQDPAEQMKAWQTVGYPRLKAAGVEGIDPNTLPDPATRKMYLAQATSVQEAIERVKAKYSPNIKTAQGGFAKFDPATQSMVLLPGAKPVPPKSASSGGSGMAVSGSGDPNADLSKLSPNDQALVKQLASRQLLVGRAGGFQLNNPRNQSLYALAVRINPSLNVVDNAAYQDFVKDLAKSSANSAGGRINSANRMLGHAADLIDKLNELKPGSGAAGKIGNVLAYPAERAFGSKIAAVSFIKSKLLAEAATLVTGGVPHAQELMEDIKNTPDTATREQWSNIIKAIADIGMEQVSAVEEKRNNLLGGMAPNTSLLSQKAQKNLSRIYKYAGAEPPQMAPASGSGYTNTAIAGNPNAVGPKKSYSTDDLLKLFGK